MEFDFKMKVYKLKEVTTMKQEWAKKRMEQQKAPNFPLLNSRPSSTLALEYLENANLKIQVSGYNSWPLD